MLNSNDVVGIMALKSFENGEIISVPFSNNNYLSTIYDIEHNGDRGERSLVFKTSILKGYPFPIISGECFMTESVVYDKLGQNYKFLVLNEILTVCEYQAGGLSSNPKRLMYNNPGGYAIYFTQRANYSKEIKELIKYLIQANCFIHIFKGKQTIVRPSNRLLYYVLKPFGLIASFHYKKYAR